MRLDGWARHALVVAVLALVAAWIALPVFDVPPFIYPFNYDNVDALQLAMSYSPDTFFTNAGQVYRPFTYFSLWLQHEISGFTLSAFYSLNLFLWLACAVVAYLLVFVNTASWMAAGAAALLLLTDDRFFTALVWLIERQTTMACVFGALGLVGAYAAQRLDTPKRILLAGIYIALVLAALSKEFGLAFALAVATVAIVGSPRYRSALLRIAAAAIVTYLALRWIVASGPLLGSETSSNRGFFQGSEPEYAGRGLCEMMGLGGTIEHVCYGDLGTGEKLGRYAWNIAATFVGIIFPPLIGDNGEIVAPTFLGETFGASQGYVGFSWSSLIVPTVVLALAIVGWRRNPRLTLPLLVVIVGNALLSFLYFRDRNVLAGVIALYATAGIGATYLAAWAKENWLTGRPPWMRIAVVAIVPLALAYATATRGDAFSEELDGAKGNYATRNPCDEVENFGRTVPQRIAEKFDLPDC